MYLSAITGKIVRQGGVLSPILFSAYIDDVICALRKSGYGVYIGFFHGMHTLCR